MPSGDPRSVTKHSGKKLVASGSSDEDSDPDDTALLTGFFNGRTGKQRLGLGLAVSACIAGLATVFVLSQEAPPHLYSGWNKKHVDDACQNVVIPDARRLSKTKKSQKELRSGKKRRLEAAVFDPSLLYKLKLFGKYKMPYYGSCNLEEDIPNEAREAIFFFHGAMRNAQDYFCAIKATIEATLKEDRGSIDKKPEDYIIIAPKYHYLQDLASHSAYHVHDDDEDHDDSLITDELFWNGSAPYGDWRGGADADSKSDADFNSFEVIDEMLLILSDKAKFPKMERIVLAGHSAGGQAVQRYAMVTHLRPQSLADDVTLKEMKSLRPGIDVRYIVANPSSFCYLDAHRWMYGWDDATSNWSPMMYKEYDYLSGRKGWDDGSSRRRRAKADNTTEPWGVKSPTYQPWSPLTPFVCRDSSFNDWHYGLNWTHPTYGDLVPYLEQHPHLHRATEFYAARDVIYLVGQNDTCSDDMLGSRQTCSASCWSRNFPVTPHPELMAPCMRNSMDVRCPAMLQGPTRNARARGYMYHLKTFFGKPVHRLYQISGVGHQAQAMFNSPLGRKALFEQSADQVDGCNVQQTVEHH